jgi:glycosyltransferase involved in cell wall biosynthesis
VEAGLIDPEECYIVFVGHTGWNVSNLLDEIRANPITRDRFIIYEAVTDEFLVSLYQEARMVVFPSFYEGFGLSLVEAIGLGKACIASDTPALVEVAAGRAVHVPAKDVFSWAEQMALLFNDDVSLTKLEKATEKGLIHSWDDAAAEFFKEVME